MSFRSTGPSDLVKVDMLLNGDQVDALSFIAHRDKAYPPRAPAVRKAQATTSRASSSKFPFRRPSAARSSRAKRCKAMRKDVLAKCYGGDITRKKKLLEKQKEGKKKMRSARHGADPDGGLPRGAQAGRIKFSGKSRPNATVRAASLCGCYFALLAATALLLLNDSIRKARRYNVC